MDEVFCHANRGHAVSVYRAVAADAVSVVISLLIFMLFVRRALWRLFGRTEQA